MFLLLGSSLLSLFSGPAMDFAGDPAFGQRTWHTSGRDEALQARFKANRACCSQSETADEVIRSYVSSCSTQFGTIRLGGYNLTLSTCISPYHRYVPIVRPVRPPIPIPGLPLSPALPTAVARPNPSLNFASRRCGAREERGSHGLRKESTRRERRPYLRHNHSISASYTSLSRMAGISTPA